MQEAFGDESALESTPPLRAASTQPQSLIPLYPPCVPPCVLPCRPSAVYAAPSLAERLAALPQLYTDTPLSAHSEVDALRYFQLSAAQQAALPPLLSAAFAEEWETCGAYVQLHPAYLPFIDRLSSLDSPKGRYFLRKPWLVHGPHGSGRSALLVYLHLWADARQWLTVSVQADEFTRETMGWHTDNPTRQGIRDQPLYTQHFFGQLKARQEAQLRRVRLKRSYDYAPDCRSLYDLVDAAHQSTPLAVAATQHPTAWRASTPPSPLRLTSAAAPVLPPVLPRSRWCCTTSWMSCGTPPSPLCSALPPPSAAQRRPSLDC